MFTVIFGGLSIISFIAIALFMFFGYWLDAVRTLMVALWATYIWATQVWPYEKDEM